MGVATIMEVKELVLVFCGRNKAMAMYKTVECQINHMCPASAMQLHNNCTAVSDVAATLELRVRTSKHFRGLMKQMEEQEHSTPLLKRRKLTATETEVLKLTTKPNLDSRNE